MADSSFEQLLLVSSIAFFVPVIIARLPGRAVPAVIGEIFAGVIVGTSGFHAVKDSQILDFFAEFGFAFLMFLSGLEVDASVLLTRNGKTASSGLASLLATPAVAALIVFAGTLAIAFLGVGLLSALGLAPDIWLTTLMLSTTSVGLVVPVLKEKGLLNRPFGQTIMVSAFIADFVTLLAIGAFAAIKREGISAELGLVTLLPLSFVIVWRIATTLGHLRFVSRTMEELAHATSQLDVRGSMALMIAFVVLAETTGAELILGSFVAGVIVSLLSPSEGAAIRTKLDAIGYGFFIPIFFVSVGADLDLRAAGNSADDLALLPAFVLIAFASKLLPAFVLRTQFSGRETVAAGFLLSSRLSLIIAASLIGLELGIFSQGVNAVVILVALVMSTVSPVMFSRLISSPRGEILSVLIVGGGETGRALGSRLESQGALVSIIDRDQQVVEELTAHGLSVTHGDATAVEVLQRAGVETANAFVAVTPDDDFNLHACEMARDRFGLSRLLVSLNDPANAGKLQQAGVRVVSVPQATSGALLNAILRPNISQLLVDEPQGYNVVEVAIGAYSAGRRLSEIRLPGNCIIMLIRRDDANLVPRGSTRLAAGDVATLAGDADSLRDAIALLHAG
jgi:Kef-type K+ transport system membrane component KefB/Trk K+ transport system NAD-binding subunit